MLEESWRHSPFVRPPQAGRKCYSGVRLSSLSPLLPTQKQVAAGLVPASLTTGHLSLGSKDIWILLARMTSCSEEWFQCRILSLPPAPYLDFGTWKTVGRCDNPRVRGELQK